MRLATQFRMMGYASAMLFVLGIGVDYANAQFLEKLEAEIRSRLEAAQQTPSPSASEELPPPKAIPPENGSNGAATQLPAAQLPSILETPVVPMPVPADDRPIPATGGIYLGLEAEEAIGGGLGVRVSNVTRNSPAWKAGFEVGDRIQAINGAAISNLESMAAQLSSAQPRDVLRCLIARGGKNLELTAVLIDANLAAATLGAQNLPMQMQDPRTAGLPATATGPAWLGLTANDLTASFRQQFGISVFRGAAVTNVVSGSPAATGGIRAGDAVTAIGGQAVEKAEDLLAWVERARPGDVVELMVARGFSVRPVMITFAENPKEKQPLRFSGRAPVPPAELALTPSANNEPVDVLPTQEPVAKEPMNVGPSPRELALERELEQVREQLQQANAQLAETQKKLDDIAKALRK